MRKRVEVEVSSSEYLRASSCSNGTAKMGATRTRKAMEATVFMLAFGFEVKAMLDRGYSNNKIE